MERPVSLPGLPAWAPLLTQQVPRLQGVQRNGCLSRHLPPPLQLTSRAVTKDDIWEEGGGPSGAYKSLGFLGSEPVFGRSACSTV